MAFTEQARKRLENFVRDARRIIEDDFRRQLQSIFGMDPEKGIVAELSSLWHLNTTMFETASDLRRIYWHYMAQEAEGKAIPSRSGAFDPQQSVFVLKRILREQTQTALLRLCAIRMAEERGVLLPSLQDGMQSTGFVNYKLVVGSALGGQFATYEKYLKSIFDELAEDLPQLFDRTLPYGLLFLSESAFMALLAEINAGDLISSGQEKSFWAEDETIGWIFQYFNMPEERGDMRKKVPNPKNSYEIAVRNQFFTPRYVVKFLIDNTLGRRWVEETNGDTRLLTLCRFLVWKGQKGQKPATLRDPRGLKVLDPACGSMHFGLYAFDVLEAIYEECWDWLSENSERRLKLIPDGMLPLQSAYDTKEAFLRAVPGLIIANNLYGVDIDVRATQIASLALWLRAHRSLAQLRVPSVERGSMGRGNVIAATAPPPEKNLRARVQNALTGSASHGFKALESDFLRLIPETGILLPLEDSLKSVKEASAAAYSREIAGDLFGGEPEGTQLHLVLESSDWDRQRDAVRSALNLYIKEAGHSFQERLFAQDADDCLRLIDLCTLKFDAIVMNPPFGSPTDGSRETLGKLFPTTKKEIIGMFILRMIRMLKSGGYVGTISSRTLFFQTSTEKWREEVLFGNTNMPVFLDLGLGVMDGAMVEAAAYVIGSGKSDEKTVFVNAIHAGKSDAMVAFVHDDKNQTVKALDSFESAPGRALVYFAGDDILGVYGNKQYGFVRPSQGLATADNDRYVRLVWEVESAQKSWVPLAKGGEARPFYGDVPTEVNWASDGDEVKKDICFKYPYLKGNYSFVVKNESDYFHPGLTWSHRAQSLQLRVFPKDGIFDRKGCCVFVTNDDTEQLLSTMAILNSRAFQNLVTFRISWVEGNSCYECGLLSSTPFPKFDEDNRKLLAAWAEQNFNARRKLDSVNEESRAFVLPELIQVANEELNREAELKLIIESQDAIDQKADELYGLKSKRIEKQEKSRQLPAPTDLEKKNRLVSWAVGVAFGRFDWRLAIGEREIPAVGGPFDSYPALAPGRLPAGDAPLVPNSGIFVMDPSHSKDLTAAVRQVFQTCFLDDTIDIHEWLVKDFFKFHLGTYSAAARVAPIYWPIGTASGSYVLWLYYPKLSSNMLFGALNEFVDPKLLAETRRYEEMQREASEPTTAQRRELERQAVFIAELNALRDKLQNLANTFNVHFDDGVALNAVRFMPLIQSKDWLKKLEKTKAALEKGELDWSETAADLYPERVRQACKKNPSIKLAHSKRDWFDADEASS